MEKNPQHHPKISVYSMHCLFLPYIFPGLVYGTVCVSSQRLFKTNMPIRFL